MKATPYIVAAVLCGVGAYLVTGYVVNQSDSTTPVNQTASDSKSTTGDNSSPSWRENPYGSPDVAPPGQSPFTISPPASAPIPPGTLPVAPKPKTKSAANPDAKADAIANPNPLGTAPVFEPTVIAPSQGSTQSSGDAGPDSNDASGTHIDIAASLVLGLMDKKYHTMSSFAATVDCRTSDSPDQPIVHGLIAFRRSPERAVALISQPQPKTVLYDGSNIIVFPSPDQNHYTKTANFFSNLHGSGISAVLGRLVDDPSRDVLSRLIASDYNSQHSLEPFQRLDKGDMATVNATLCDRVIATRDKDIVTLYVGHKDHALRRIEWTDAATGGKAWWYFEDFSGVRMSNSIAPDLFAFRPPTGITQYQSPGP